MTRREAQQILSAHWDMIESYESRLAVVDEGLVDLEKIKHRKPEWPIGVGMLETFVRTAWERAAKIAG